MILALLGSLEQALRHSLFLLFSGYAMDLLFACNRSPGLEAAR
jgi:hypothetical protein